MYKTQKFQWYTTRTVYIFIQMALQAADACSSLVVVVKLEVVVIVVLVVVVLLVVLLVVVVVLVAVVVVLVGHNVNIDTRYLCLLSGISIQLQTY